MAAITICSDFQFSSVQFSSVAQSCPTLCDPRDCSPPGSSVCEDSPGKNIGVGSVQFSSVTQSCPTLCDPMNCSTPGLPVHHQLQSSLKLMSIEPVMPSSHLILCRPLFLLPPTPPNISESALCMRGQSTGVSALASFLPKKSQG